jgi:nucleoid DNA-binding protein
MTKNKKSPITSKEKLIIRIQKETKENKTKIKEIVDAFLQEVNKSLIKCEEIRLVGHFTLKTDLKAESKAMNLQTGIKNDGSGSLCS